MKLGSSGVGVGMVMWVRWQDLQQAVTEILGYSYRYTTTNPPAPNNHMHWLRRLLPWQHPFWNQLVAHEITSIKGAIGKGNSVDEKADLFEVAKGSLGAGYNVNSGPWSEFLLAQIVVAFWRPPYFLRTDESILDDAGQPQEWLRYVEKTRSVSNQMLSQAGNCFNWAPNQLTSTSLGPPGSIGRPVTHQKLTLRWYEVPEACIFGSDWPGDGTPGGQAYNTVYTQLLTTNPITGLAYQGRSYNADGSINIVGSPIQFTVNSPFGGGVDDSDPANRFFGCFMGTLRFDSVEYHPRPLQLPAVLMQIPGMSGSPNEAVSQVQYDVVMHFDLFDPPRAATVANSVVATAGGGTVGEACRGHNTVPFFGDGQWYAIVSQNNVTGTSHKGTMFNYADFRNLFNVL